jgi:hypothetical protein
VSRPGSALQTSVRLQVEVKREGVSHTAVDDKTWGESETARQEQK